MEIKKENIVRITIEGEELESLQSALFQIKQLNKLVRNINKKDKTLENAIPTLNKIIEGEYKIYE